MRRAIKGSIGHVEVFQMDGVATPIIGRPRPLPGHDTPNPAYHPHTLNYEEPVSMGFLLNPEANLLVAISLFYIGIGLFQAAVLANGPYNKNYLRYPRSYYCAQATLYLAALILSLLFASNPITVLSIATIFTLAIAIASHFISFWVTRTKQYSVPYWGFF